MSEIWTYQDCIESVVDAFNGELSDRCKRFARRAIAEALREIANTRTWSYFYRRGKITTVAQQTTGSITYVHATRTATLSGATFPADAQYYELLISGIRYEIDSYTDSTNVVLSSSQNPGADISTATSYSLLRDTYPLPDDFVTMGTLMDATDGCRQIPQATVNDITLSNRAIRSPGVPNLYAVTKVAENQGGIGVIFSPPPSAARVYDFAYQARPRPLATEQYKAGTVTSAAASALLTGTGTAFAAAHVGSVIRLSGSSTVLPTSIIGGLSNDFNPFAYQRVIKAVNSASGAGALTLDSAIDATLTGVKYTISDPIDIEPGAMHTAFLRLAEAQYAQLIGRADAIPRRKTAEMTLYEAASADNRLMSGADNPLGRHATGTLADYVGSVGTI